MWSISVARPPGRVRTASSVQGLVHGEGSRPHPPHTHTHPTASRGLRPEHLTSTRSCDLRPHPWEVGKFPSPVWSWRDEAEGARRDLSPGHRWGAPQRPPSRPCSKRPVSSLPADPSSPPRSTSPSLRVPAHIFHCLLSPRPSPFCTDPKVTVPQGHRTPAEISREWSLRPEAKPQG